MKELSGEARKAIEDRTPLAGANRWFPSSRVGSNSFSVRGGKLLTDRMIDRYAREGYYGPRIQRIALALQASKASQRRPLSAVEAAQKLLQKWLKEKK